MNTAMARKWFRLGLLNLAIVALLGTLMRYKIAYNFPFFEQKNLLHAHSHFAFNGWISHFLFTGLAWMICKYLDEGRQKKYQWMVILNLVFAYGMLFSFAMQGYAAISISFSTASILLSMVFVLSFINDAFYFPKNYPAKRWAIAGLLLNVLSAAGPLFLGYMMATGTIDHRNYLGSIYYFLHFQYSGWFFFASMALVISQLPASFPSLKKYFSVFVATVIPTYFLSVLWAKLPQGLYIVTVVATLLQMLAWFWLIYKSWPFFKNLSTLPTWVNWFFYAALFALSVKFILQTISVVPSLSQLVFGIRPIVIAYLHLVLLAVYSLFIIGFLLARGFLEINKTVKLAALLFFAGVFINESLLGIQGFAAFFYVPVPYINEMLFFTAVLLLLSAAGMYVFQKKKLTRQDL